ncbi:DUF3810 family protein [Niallia taxi]|uniref:DUF3810 family protein n=1 Tax=Niallia taxi TaxID=2499688 RepID=UPI0015F3D521|nr:DUF3810 family protein [Niallia taxi]
MKFLKIFFWIFIVSFILTFIVFSIQCLLSAWWNIIFLLIIIVAIIWMKKRKKNQQSFWQGLIVIIISLLLFAWFYIPCIVGHYKELLSDSDTKVTDSHEHYHTSDIVGDGKKEEEKAEQAKREQEEKNQAEQAKKDQEEREKAEQAKKDQEEREKAEQAKKEQEEKERAEEAKEPELDASCDIKGNVSDSGEKIYHVPGGRFYDITVPEDIFCSESAARAAGYRKSKM